MDLNHLSTGKKMAVFAACAVLLAVLPFLVGGALGNSWVRIIDFALLYVMLALGLNIVVASPACWTWASSPSTRSAPIPTRC